MTKQRIEQLLIELEIKSNELSQFLIDLEEQYSDCFCLSQKDYDKLSKKLEKLDKFESSITYYIRNNQLNNIITEDEYYIYHSRIFSITHEVYKKAFSILDTVDISH